MPRLPPISDAERKKRKPTPPLLLLSARHDRVHEESGVTRPGRSVRASTDDHVPDGYWDALIKRIRESPMVPESTGEIPEPLI